MAKRPIEWDSVPFILNQISWHLKTISDTLQTVAEAEDSPPVAEFKRSRSLEKLKSLNAVKNQELDEIVRVIRDES